MNTERGKRTERTAMANNTREALHTRGLDLDNKRHVYANNAGQEKK